MITILIQEARPKLFSEVAGQTLVKEALKAIIKDPIKAPRSMILQGAYGSGKTTQVRIFSKAINCPNKQGFEPCNKPDCSICSQQLDNSSFYIEYDSSVVGNVDKIKELRDTFYYTIPNQHKIIVFDECHLASNKAQSALLKVIEEAPQGIFFFFCTTHINKLIPTIRSRSLELRVSTVSTVDVVANLKRVAEKFNIDIEESIMETIALKSRGHMRNAHMLLDTYTLLGKEKFLESTKSAKDALSLYLMAIVKRDIQSLYKSISLLQTFPVADVKEDFNLLMLSLVRKVVVPDETEESKVAKALGNNLFKIVKTYSSDWFSNSFDNDIQMQTALLALYQLLTPSTTSQPSKIRTK